YCDSMAGLATGKKAVFYAAGALAGSGPGAPAMPDTPADMARSGAGHALGRVHRASVGVALVPGQGLADQMRRVSPAGTGAAEIIQQLFAVVRMRAAFDDAGRAFARRQVAQVG